MFQPNEMLVYFVVEIVGLAGSSTGVESDVATLASCPLSSADIAC